MRRNNRPVPEHRAERVAEVRTRDILVGDTPAADILVGDTLAAVTLEVHILAEEEPDGEESGQAQREAEG